MFDYLPAGQQQQTEEQKALSQIEEIVKLSYSSLARLARDYYMLHQKFWTGNPAMKIQVLGTNAKKFFEDSEDKQDFLESEMGFDEDGNPKYKRLGIPECFSIEWHEDGSGVLFAIEPEPDEEQPTE